MGGCSLQGGIGTIPGTVLGVLFLRTVIDGVAKIIKTGADVYEGLIVGILVVVAVAFNELRQSQGRSVRLFTGPLGIVAAGIIVLLAATLTGLFGVNSAWGGRPMALVGGLAALALLVAIKAWELRRQLVRNGK